MYQSSAYIVRFEVKIHHSDLQGSPYYKAVIPTKIHVQETILCSLHPSKMPLWKLMFLTLNFKAEH